jgi:predicted DNA-binding protein
MFIHDPPKRQQRKELKVNLPARQHRHLRALQGATGREAPVIVAEALESYFAKLAAEAREKSAA